jgi:hypothetical protein
MPFPGLPDRTQAKQAFGGSPLGRNFNIIIGAKAFTKRLFTVPAAKRAGPHGQQLLAAAQAGDIQASADLERLTRWAATSAAKQVYAGYYAQLAPRMKLPPQSGAPGTPVAFTQMSARVKARKASSERTPRAQAYRPPRPAAGVRQPRMAAQVPAEAYEGRQQKTYERSTGERFAKRFDPLTGLVWRVPESDSRYESWPTRRPKGGTRFGGGPSRAGRRGGGGAATRAATRVAGRLPAAAAEIGVGTAAALAAVGAAAYYITSRVLDDIAQGNTAANVVGLVTAMAHSQLTRKLKRQPTMPEYRAMVAEVRTQLTEAVKQSMAPSLKTQLRNFLNLFR